MCPLRRLGGVGKKAAVLPSLGSEGIDAIAEADRSTPARMIFQSVYSRSGLHGTGTAAVTEQNNRRRTVILSGCPMWPLDGHGAVSPCA